MTTRRKCLWVGGPPGSSFINMQQRLAKHGLDVIDKVEDFYPASTIPKGVELVLLNTEMCGHGSYNLCKAECKRTGVPLITAGTKLTRTLQALRESGWITEPQPETPVESRAQRRSASVGPYTVWGQWDGNDVVILYTDESGVRRSGRPVLVDETEFFIDHKSVAAVLGVPSRDVAAALRRTDKTLNGMPLRFATWPEVIYSLPHVVHDTSATCEPALDEPLFLPETDTPVEIDMPLETTPTVTVSADQPPVVFPAPFTLPAKPSNQDALNNEINEAFIAMAKWPHLRIYLMPGLMKAQEAALSK